MKITREIKTAILVIASILLFIWGYSFLKGKDLFTSYNTFFVKYDNVEGLVVSSPITINGRVVGKVIGIKLDENWQNIVELQVKEEFHITPSTVAEIYAPSPIGGKQIALIPNKSEKTLAENGAFLKSNSKLGMAEALAAQMVPLKTKIETLLDNANIMLQNMNQVLDQKAQQDIKASLSNLNKTLAEFHTASTQVNGMLADNKSKMNGIVTNFHKVSGDFTKISDSLSHANIGKTVKNLEQTLVSVNKIMNNLQAGKGSMGKMLNDDAMYNNLAKTSKELELLLQDVRLYPTRYVNVSLFGKKNKPYIAPTIDTIQKK
ncbi:MlaD family protein [Flavobacterium branchiophilum]|uniref:Organic solvent ABC transporter substrate-binding protein n=1 Tax=Flavobacterium branchiophilum TaxID=55197 RepID=A0A2H3KXW0_9FLAO|nr:MlaD family protein [Flavobacterium branchiophilum]PDS24384.1 organic solvent ABC transporter substrate-binding protein [Flavobacterium branchiophilum]